MNELNGTHHQNKSLKIMIENSYNPVIDYYPDENIFIFAKNSIKVK